MKFARFLSLSASPLALLATPVAAQTTGAPAPSDAPPSGQVEPAPDQIDTGGDIVVTGIRQSQRAAIDAKRDSTVVADVLTAQDIGKFPDKNVAEALQRVPGVVINREFGEGERVSLRGTAPNLTRTLVNGHGIATADWFVLEQLSATRSFNYLTLPAEIVGQVDVYKSPQADIDEGGVGGTINVHTRDPLDLKAWTLSASAQVVYSELADKLDPQASGLVSWRNDEETFGILVGGVYQKRRIRRDGVEVLGYFTQTPGGPLVPSLIGSALFQQERERYGGNIGVQWRPVDDVEFNVTGLYSRFNADNVNANFLAWGSNALGGGGTLTNATITDGTAVSGTITSTPTGRAAVYDVIDRKAFSEVYSGDFDLTWRPGGGPTTMHFKIGYTEAQGDTVNQPFYEGGAPGSFTYDLTGRTPQVSFSGFDPADPSDLIFDFASLHQITNDDSEFYAYFDAQQQLGDDDRTFLKAGFKFSDHDRVATFLATTYGGFFLPLADPTSGTGCGGRPCTSADFAGGLTPDDYLSNIAGPNTLRRYWTVDRRKLQDIFFGQPAQNRARILNPPENFSVNEKIYGSYVMLQFGGDRYSGNVGARFIRTDQVSTGNVVGTGGPGSVTNAFGNFTPVRIERSYDDFLPSANFKFNVTDTLVLRAAAARTVARPDYTDIVPRVSLNPGALSGDGGDPLVDPFRANSVDVSVEWYPDRDTIVAAALYYKDIKSYIVNRTTQEVFPVETNTPNLSRCQPAGTGNPNLYNCLFDINRRSNGSGGTNKGVELQVSRPIYAGFGAIVNYTYSDAKSDAGDPIPGNSKHALNVTGYFENELLSARLSYNYRSEFFINIDRASPLNQKATESLDASVNVTVTPRVVLTFDAVNLTNEKIEQYSGTNTRPRAIYDNGRQFYGGVRFRY